MESVSASLEDYLEAIFHIVAEKQAARPKDISGRLGVNNSSVTGALKLLSEKGLVNYSPYDLITLTREGKTVAEDVVRRHEALRDFFENVLAVSRPDAEDAACRMEHSVSRNILNRFIDFTEFVEVCPRGGTKWIAGFGYYCEHGSRRANCERCISRCLDEVRGKKPEEKGAPRMSISLKDLKPGQKSRIVKVGAHGGINKRIAEMGMTRGTLIEIERVAPLGDPIEIKVKGYHLSLRKEEAEGILVEVV
ncbi:MAG: DtxR family transcriptional regulator [Planctomycetes bacterium]|nr:DtxR family transcriptional regulator [Planctomycetota bacterium]